MGLGEEKGLTFCDWSEIEVLLTGAGGAGGGGGGGEGGDGEVGGGVEGW